MSVIKTTWWAIRAMCPFGSIDGMGPEDTIPQLKDVNEAVRRYQRPRDFFTQRYYLRLHERADYRDAPMELRLFVWKYMRALRARGLPFYVHTCWRDPADQQRLVDKGYSKVRSGAHQRSCAVDIVSAIDHWDIPEELWHYVGTLGESVARGLHLGQGLDGETLKIEWGGRWSFYDPAHWQLSDWRKRPVATSDEQLTLLPYSDKMRFG